MNPIGLGFLLPLEWLAPALALAGLALMVGTLARLLLGRHVWSLVVAHVVSQAVISASGWLLRLAVVRWALLAAAAAFALWLIPHI
ncbi:MAG: hypothetical protein KIT25_17040 [Enhydrobacter sp.]|nr:MAG: hypothetical protein KIT25_17040 [Enhydrobacter sp.]